MVKHIVLWSFKPELTVKEQEEAGEEIKRRLEAVKEQVQGVISLEVKLSPLPSSNRALALISAFESVDALNGYQTHPAHVAAGAYVKSVTCDRACFDFEE